MGFNALWWWIDRWRKSTAYTDMTLEEQAAYRNLLDEATLRGGLVPLDERILAKACGDALAWPRVRGAVLARFERTVEGYRHATLDEVLKETARRARNQANWRARRKGTDNARDNAPDNAAGLNPGLKPDSPDPDPDLDLEDLKSTAAARRLAQVTEGTFGLYVRIAREAIALSLAQDGTDRLDNVLELFKTLCAQRLLAYDGELAVRAVSAAAHTDARGIA